MSKSARIAIPSSLASRSSLTPPAASSASPRNTPTPPLKWKPQKQAPPRSKLLGARAILNPSVEDGKGTQPSQPLWTLVGQSFLTVPLSFLTFHRALPDNWFRCSSLCVSSFLSSFNSRLSTSLRSPPVYNELPSWLLNPACSIARAPAN